MSSTWQGTERATGATLQRRAAVSGSVILILGLAVVGFRLAYDLSYRFAAPACPFVEGEPIICAGGGLTNGDEYFLTWWGGGALAVATVGVVLVLLGRRVRRARRNAQRIVTSLKILLVALMALGGFVLAQMLAFEFLTANQSFLCSGLGCDDYTVVNAPERPNFIPWGFLGAVIGVLVSLVLLRLGRVIRPSTLALTTPARN